MERISTTYVAIDKLSLILPHDVYVKIHLPRPQEISEEGLTTIFKSMNASEKKETHSRIASLKEMVIIAEKAAEKTR